MNCCIRCSLPELLTDRQYSLSEYANGMLDGLIYNMYLWVCIVCGHAESFSVDC
jgi:hypothetical protein